MLSITRRVFFNRAICGFVGMLGALVLFAGCSDDPKTNLSTGGQAGSGSGGQGGSGGSAPGLDWTTFTESADTKKIYVSNSDGNDANDGSAPDKAVKTLAKGTSLLRDGMPDWLLLKRGDVWLEPLGEWTKSGRSTTEPMVVMSYGDLTARPILKTGANTALLAITGPLRHLAFVGLHLYAHTRDPDSSDFMGANGGPGIQWLAPSEDLLFEDLLVQYYAIANINLKASMLNVRVRRSVIVDSYDISDHAQGLYIEGVDGVTVEENVFDHNGWNTSASLAGKANPTIYNHNLYIQATCNNVTIRGNSSSRAASHGIQALAGGTVTGNIVFGNPVGLSYGSMPDEWDPKAGGISGTVSGNVIRDSGDVDAATTRGIGIQIGNIKSATVEDNILAHDATASATSAIAIEVRRKTSPQVADEKVQNLTLQNNVIYDWRGGIRYTTSALTAVKLQNNDVQALVRPSELVNYFGTTFSAETSYAGNHWNSKADPAAWFILGATNQSYDQWLTTSGEQGATNTVVIYPDALRDLASYHQKLGKAATLDAYLAEVRLQSRANWRLEYTAQGPIAFIRQGFGRK